MSATPCIRRACSPRCLCPPTAISLALPPGRGLAVVLGEVQDPGNAGSIIRTAAAAGADGLIATSGTVDLYAPKVVRAGMGAHLRLPLRVSQPWAALAPWLAARDQVVVADGRADRTLYEVDWRRDTVLVLGNEARGHDADTLADVANALRVAIPMPGGSESLNVAAAAAVLLYEAVRQRAVQVSSMAAPQQRQPIHIFGFCPSCSSSPGHFLCRAFFGRMYPENGVGF